MTEVGISRDLPQTSGGLFLTEAGLETELVFHDGIDLPLFAAFDLLKDEEGTERLRSYYLEYVELAKAHATGLVLETPTWRASSRWAEEIGYDDAELEAINRKAVALMDEVREAATEAGVEMLISGQIGPQDDGYNPSGLLSEAEAERYHSPQISTLTDGGVDMVSALTMTYPEEAIGIARAAGTAEIPVAISFTVETDGRLPNGDDLGAAIERVDEATGGSVAYFMINCAHPTHFDEVIAGDEDWVGRIRGLRANASERSHAELDEATELDEGDPADLGARYAALREHMPGLTVLGGCCGTDIRHVEAIVRAWSAA